MIARFYIFVGNEITSLSIYALLPQLTQRLSNIITLYTRTRKNIEWYNVYSSSARVNVHEECMHKLEADNFWPNGITFRRWKTHEDFLKDREVDKQNRRDSYRERRDRRNYNSYDNNTERNRNINTGRNSNDDQYDTYTGNNSNDY